MGYPSMEVPNSFWRNLGPDRDWSKIAKVDVNNILNIVNYYSV